MLLRLRYNDTALHVSTAAFVRGNSPLEWLKEISRWNIATEYLECYILPSSIENLSPAGLFVIFKNQGKQPGDLLDPYSEIAKGIYVPVNSVLTPTTTAEELKAICIWECQVFHPLNGFTGFEKKDRLDLADLLRTTNPKVTDWSFAHPGIPVKPALSQINVLQPSVQEVIDDFKKNIENKPLNEIPKNKKQRNSWLYKILDWLKWIFFLLIHFIARLLNKLFPRSVTNLKPGSPRKEPGVLNRIEQWINRNLEELQKKRDSELKRLLTMFDDNTDEALRYAIPLDSPYMNRGKAPQSDTLFRRTFNFGLGNLGGGAAADVWDVGRHYHDLRSKYINAAQKEVHRKDFKKAAYIYAHLLGDYYAAANALEQGAYYREAAALYKDHLKNIASAAACLERGGLYLEAIELYKQLQQHEKTGDLYEAISRKTEAEFYYEQTVDIKLHNSDYVDAGRVIKEKLKNPDRAKQTLLNGWDLDKQSEHCLKNYFELVRETDNEAIEQKVREIYKHHTPKPKKKRFLEVLKDVYTQKKDSSEQDCYLNIAYEITSEQAEEGNLYALNDLSHFIADDEFISSDCSRYIHNRRNRLQEKRYPGIFHLDASIKWQEAAWHRNQFLVVGIKNGVAHMARCNWAENIEYYTWINPVKPNTHFHFSNSPYYSSHVILFSSDGLPVTRKNLPKNKYFQDALIVNCPIWLHKRKAQFLVSEENEIVLLASENSVATLHYHSIEGDLKRSVTCYLSNDGGNFSLPSLNIPFACREDYYYTYSNKDFFIIAKTGLTENFTFHSIIRNFAISQPYTDLWIVISTNQGCKLCKPANGALNPATPIFASDFIPNSIVFIASDLFVLVEKKRAILFQIPDDEQPILVKEFDTHSSIVSAMPASSRHRFLLLEETGRMTFCETGIVS